MLAALDRRLWASGRAVQGRREQQAKLRPATRLALDLDPPPGLLHDAVLTQVPGSERSAVHAAIAANSAAAIVTAAYEDVISVADHAWRAGTELNPESALELYETAIQRALARSATFPLVAFQCSYFAGTHSQPAEPAPTMTFDPREV